MMRKLTALVFVPVMFILLYAVSVSVWAATVQTFATAGGTVAIEAENVVIDYGQFNIVNVTGASGGAAVQAVGKVVTVIPALETAGGLEFNVKVDEAGTYKVWVRVYAKDDSMDSAYFSVDRTAFVNTPYPRLGAEVKFDWKLVKTTATKNAGDIINVKVNTRETGNLVDKFIITKLSSTPVGEGEIK